jgi:hypothetical protein
MSTDKVTHPGDARAPSTDKAPANTKDRPSTRQLPEVAKNPEGTPPSGADRTAADKLEQSGYPKDRSKV